MLVDILQLVGDEELGGISEVNIVNLERWSSEVYVLVVSMQLTSGWWGVFSNIC